MQKKYLMAVDAGTGSVRAVIFDTSGNQIGCVSREWTHYEDPRYPGSMDFDWVNNWNLARDCIRGVLAEAGIDSHDIAALSTTCMREGIVLYDAAGNEIWACANVDSRSTGEVSELIRMNPALEKEIYLKSGETYALGALPRLLWVKNKMPDVYEKTATVGMFNDWLIYKMTGVLAVEPSNGSTTGLFSLKTRKWAPEISRTCGLRDDIFPAVAECGSVAASVSTAGAAATGLAEGTPVVVGGGDAQLGCIGLNVVRPGQAAVLGGSFWQYICNTADSAADPNCRVRVNCHAIPGLWQYEALAFQPGLIMRWYRDAFCQAEVREAAASGVDPYERMEQYAKEIPAGCHGMMCAFSDVMNFISWKHAAPTFTNFAIDAEKFNRYTFYRAIMENAAAVTRGHLELVKDATGNMPSEIVFAGGAAKSPLWCQILSDTLGLPVKVPVVKEATALGAAILAGYGVGLYDEISGDGLIKWEKTFEPNAEHNQTYGEMYGKWREIYGVQLELCNRGLTKGLWTAPGLDCRKRIERAE